MTSVLDILLRNLKVSFLFLLNFTILERFFIKCMHFPSQVVEPLFSRLIFLFSYSHLGWFARDPKILSAVGHVLLQSPRITPIRPTQIIIAEDCFQLSSVPFDVVTQIVIKPIQKLYGGKCLIICFSININSV